MWVTGNIGDMRLHRLALFALVLLPVFAWAKDRERTYDLKHVDWSLSFDARAETIFGDVTNTLAPLAPLDTVVLDAGKLTIKSVSVNGQNKSFIQDGEALKVALGAMAQAGQDLKVRVVYQGAPEAGVYFIPAQRAYPATTGMIYTQGEAEDTRYWLPTWDFPNDKASSSAHITVKPGEYALSNGALVKVDKSPTSWTYHWKMDQPHSTYLNSFIVGEYEIGTEKWDGLDVMWLVPKGLGSMGKSSFEGTADMVKFFSEQTGLRYPYAKFSQAVVSDYMFGGMENITMVTNTINTLHEANEKPAASSEGLVLHELAHQWFGDTITCRDWSHIWVNEGWASFLPSFYVRKKYGKEQYDMGRYGTLMGAYGAAKGSKRPMVSDDYGIPMDMFDGNAYGGGAARMFMLLDLLGEETFWKATKAYLEKFKFQNVTTEDLFRVFSEVSGRDLDQFRRQWFYHAGAPTLTAELDGSVLKVKNSEPDFVLDLPVGVYKSGGWKFYRMALNGAEGSLDLGDVTGAAVVVDPNCTLMIGFDKEPALTNQQVAMVFRSAPNAALKSRLMGRIGSLSGPEKQSLYEGERSKWVKNAMVNILGAGETEYLLKLSRDPDPDISTTAKFRLTAIEAKPEVVARLKEMWVGDSNPRVRAAAVRALANATNDDSLADAAWKVSSTDQGMRLFALDWWFRKDKNKARTVCLNQLKNPLNETIRVAAIRHLAVLKDAEGSKDVFNALMAVAAESSFAARSAAINALVAIGDPAAIPVIEKSKDHSLFMMRRTAQAALNSLKSK